MNLMQMSEVVGAKYLNKKYSSHTTFTILFIPAASFFTETRQNTEGFFVTKPKVLISPFGNQFNFTATWS